jgi:CubicO group peptidase (beta-lactamase class C family)
VTDSRVAKAVNDTLDLAPHHGEVSLAGLVRAVGDSQGRPIVVNTAELPAGVSGQWRQYADYDEFLIQDGLPTADRTLAHELGHLVLGHDGIPVTEVARETAEVASDDLISYMLNQRRVAGPNPLSFGHGGSGGSYGFVDLEHQIGYAYVMNRFDATKCNADPRSTALSDEVYRALGVL